MRKRTEVPDLSEFLRKSAHEVPLKKLNVSSPEGLAMAQTVAQTLENVRARASGWNPELAGPGPHSASRSARDVEALAPYDYTVEFPSDGLEMRESVGGRFTCAKCGQEFDGMVEGIAHLQLNGCAKSASSQLPGDKNDWKPWHSKPDVLAGSPSRQRDANEHAADAGVNLWDDRALENVVGRILQKFRSAGDRLEKTAGNCARLRTAANYYINSLYGNAPAAKLTAIKQKVFWSLGIAA